MQCAFALISCKLAIRFNWNSFTKNIMNELLRALKELTVYDLEQLAGTTIVRAVQGAYETNRERALAQLVIDRYGVNLLKNKEIRFALIDVLSSQEASDACKKIGLNGAENYPHRKLNDRYSGPFGQARAEEFISIFGLTDELIPPLSNDLRASKVQICAAYNEKVVSKGVLHPYQRRVKDALRNHLNMGKRKMMVQMPTGAGKTVTALEILVDYLRQPDFDKLIVWIVDSNELADQALESFISLWKLRGDRSINAYRFFHEFSSNYLTCEPGIVFTSFAKAWAALDGSDSERKANFVNLCERASLVIVDEAHTSMAETYESVISKLTSYDAYLIGLSATPGRNDPYQTNELAKMYGQQLVSITDEEKNDVSDAVEYLRAEGYLASIFFEDLESGAYVTEKDEGRICSELAENPLRNEQIIKQIERAIREDQSTIVYACTKDHVLALTALCRAKGIDSGFIIGEVPQSERINLLNRFRSGSLKVLINHEILSTGVDLPNVDKLIITRPVGSAILYSQILGRALRGPKNGGNSTNYVVNINDNLVNFPSASHVYKSFKNNFSLELR
jgi:DNA repair protein RadD